MVADLTALKALDRASLFPGEAIAVGSNLYSYSPQIQITTDYYDIFVLHSDMQPGFVKLTDRRIALQNDAPVAAPPEINGAGKPILLDLTWEYYGISPPEYWFWCGDPTAGGTVENAGAWARQFYGSPGGGS